MSTATTWTINAIKNANRAAGYHWFDPGTMRFFRSRILPHVWTGPGGVYFATSDAAGFRDDDGREYNVRQFLPESGSVGTAAAAGGPFQSRNDAEAAAARLAFGDQAEGVSVHAEEFEPVSVLEQFVSECRKHGSSTAAPLDCRKLIQLHGRYHKMTENECNRGGIIYCDDELTPAARSLQTQILNLAKAIGAKGVTFDGDPRGCVVKLIWPNGETNDFGKDGWCVPTSETLEEE